MGGPLRNMAIRRTPRHSRSAQGLRNARLKSPSLDGVGALAIRFEDGIRQRDAQARANGYVQDVDYGDGRRLPMVGAPVQFDETAPPLRPAPEHGAHTEEVLLELGLDWDEIIRLKTAGAVL